MCSPLDAPWCVAVLKDSNRLLNASFQDLVCRQRVSVALQHLCLPPCWRWPPSWAVLWLCCCEGFQQSVGWLHCVCTDTCDCALESGGLVGSDDSIFHARIYNFLLQDPKCLIFYYSCLFVFFFTWNCHLFSVLLITADNTFNKSLVFPFLSISAANNHFYWPLKFNVLRCVVVLLIDSGTTFD